MVQDYRRNGMDLADEQRDQVKAIKEQLANLGTQYATNSNEENCTLHFTSAELVGVRCQQQLYVSMDGS